MKYSKKLKQLGSTNVQNYNRIKLSKTKNYWIDISKRTIGNNSSDCPDYFFPGCLGCWKWCLSRAARLCSLPILQTSSGFPSCDKTHRMCRSHLPLASPYGKCGCGNRNENVNTLPTAVPKSEKLSFISTQESCIFCWHPRNCGRLIC